jgi:molecular chaperone DnaK
MRKDADSHAEEDKQKRKLAEVHNNASRMVYETEKLLKEHADKLDEGSKSAIESSIAKVNEAAKGTDIAAIENAIEQLTQATHALSKHMYEAASKSASGPNGQESAAKGPADENVIDAEFEKAE